MPQSVKGVLTAGHQGGHPRELLARSGELLLALISSVMLDLSSREHPDPFSTDRRVRPAFTMTGSDDGDGGHEGVGA